MNRLLQKMIPIAAGIVLSMSGTGFAAPLGNTIDAFSHVLLPHYYGQMLAIDKTIPKTYPFVDNPYLTDMAMRDSIWDGSTQTIASFANILPEDYVGPEESARLVRAANEELAQLVRDKPRQYPYGVALVPMNNIPEALKILQEVHDSDTLVGIQLFSRANGKSIADPDYEEIFRLAEKLDVPIWLHPVFDTRKPDNNIVFSWEYEQSQAMMQIVQAGYFKKYPNLKIIVHHAGAMVPFFDGRIRYILPPEQAEDFKKFYVDTAILGNPGALKLAVDYFGADRVLFAADVPFGVAKGGGTKVVIDAINSLDIPDTDKQKILGGNLKKLIHKQ